MSYLEPDPIRDAEDTSGYFRVMTVRMLVGAAIGGGIFFGSLISIYLLYLVGTFLPPESKEADDPTPDSFSYVITAQDHDLA